MSKNPYEILGISEGSSEKECIKAYKRLAKKYHPDLNPNDAAAAKRMAEINAAIDQLKKEGFPSDKSAGNEYGETKQSNEDRAHMNAAAQFIKNRQYAQALNVLSRIDNRTAEWYYLASIANEKANRDRIAFNHIQEACAMEPENAAYKAIYERLMKRGADKRPRAQSAYYDDYSVNIPNKRKR